MIFIFLLPIALIYTNHAVKKRLFSNSTKALGELVEIRNKNMNFYSVGDGEKKLVFLSGGLTASPIFDFKQLVSNLESNYRVIILEKFGYGFSDDLKQIRKLETVIDDYRTMLTHKGIKPPYVLVPHSMSGIEVLYWSQKYPNEIEAIIGLDMATNKAYEDLKINRFGLNVSRFFVRLGFSRIIPRITWSDAVKNGYLNKNEIKIYEELFYCTFTSKATSNEIKTIKSNSLLIENYEISSMPLLLFSSNGKGTGFKESDWRNIQKSLRNQSENSLSRLIFLDCPHYIHNFEPDRITKEIKNFLIRL